MLARSSSATLVVAGPGVPGARNRRSKARPGSTSLGTGVVGELHDSWLSYIRAQPESAPPTGACRLRCREGKRVTLPAVRASSWSIDMPPTSTSAPVVFFAGSPVRKLASLQKWPMLSLVEDWFHRLDSTVS